MFCMFIYNHLSWCTHLLYNLHQVKNHYIWYLHPPKIKLVFKYYKNIFFINLRLYCRHCATVGLKAVTYTTVQPWRTIGEEKLRRKLKCIGDPRCTNRSLTLMQNPFFNILVKNIQTLIKDVLMICKHCSKIFPYWALGNTHKLCLQLNLGGW